MIEDSSYANINESELDKEQCRRGITRGQRTREVRTDHQPDVAFIEFCSKNIN